MCTNGLVIFLFSSEDLNTITQTHTQIGNFLAVQWLGRGAYSARGLGSIPGQGTNILQAVKHSQKKRK